MCHRERFSSYNTLSRLVPCYKRDWATLLHHCYFWYLLLATSHLTTQSLVTDNFCACRYFLAENHLWDPSTPRWVRHSYLSKGLRLIPYTCGSPLLHIDLFGPNAYKRLGVNSFGLVIVDDFPSFTWVFFLDDKKRVQNIFKNFTRKAQNQFQVKIKKFQSDNGS